MLNQASLIGNLGADPERRGNADNAPVTFSLCTNRVWRDKDGNRQEEATWHRIVVWGRTADLCVQYLAKGRKVAVVGRIANRSWKDEQTGEARWSSEIVADRVLFLDGPQGQRRDDAGAPSREEIAEHYGVDDRKGTDRDPRTHGPGGHRRAFEGGRKR